MTTWAYGQDITKSDISFASGYNANEGYFEVTIPIYDDDGYDEGLHRNEASRVELYVDNTHYATLCNLYSFHGAGDPQGTADWYWVDIKKSNSTVLKRLEAIETINSSEKAKEIHDNYTRVSCDKVGTMTKVSLRFYLNGEMLQRKSVSFGVYLYVDKNEGSNYEVRKSSPTITPLNFPYPEVSVSKVGQSGFLDFNVSVNQSYPGNLFLSATGVAAEDTDSKTFSFEVGDQAQKKTITATYKLPHTTVSKTKDVTIDQYPRIIRFEAKDSTNGTTRLEWDVPKADPNGKIIDAGNFILERCFMGSNNMWGEWETVASLSNDKRSYVDEEAQMMPLKTKYRISREKPWSAYASMEDELEKKLTHAQVTEFTSARLLTQREVELVWKWDYDKDSNNIVLTKDSKFIITREVSVDGETFMAEETHEVSCADYMDSGEVCTYKTVIPQSCVLYRWKIHLLPGDEGEYYKHKSDLGVLEYLTPKKDDKGDLIIGEDGKVEYDSNTTGINDTEIASLASFTASHGYFGDRVELHWTLSENSGSLDVFSVQRREYGGLDEKYVQIGTVEAVGGIVNYSFIDERAVPGTLYEYMIEGTKECANEDVRTTDRTNGFAAATGTVYGRITFQNENGQGVNDAEVRLETTADIYGKSYAFNNDYYLQVDNSTFSDSTKNNLSLQMFVKFDEIPVAKASLLHKEDMYELYAQDGKFFFKAGNDLLETNRSIEELGGTAKFIQLTAVLSEDSIYLYSENQLLASKKHTLQTLTPSGKLFTMGKGLKGHLDDVRVWSKALSQTDIKKTYDRYLAGDEEGLIAYWNFNFATSKEFYDFAHKGSKFYMNDGKIIDFENKYVEDAVLSGAEEDNPSVTQLSYKDYTDADGSYYIAGVPYVGNGTLYQILPRLGTHEFSPTKTQVTLSAGSVNHSANFIDQSAFPVSGTITYKGGTIPVEGVSFYVDGVVCTDSKKNIITSDAQGHFKIYVPVGTHEVKATKANHKFLNDGRITDSYGNDINYQDDRYSTVKITDITTVRYIGRVAGGSVEEAYPIGHSLSTNNLAEKLTVQLTYPNPAYKLHGSSDSIATMTHFLPSSWVAKGKKANTNEVKFRDNIVTISPNLETGEFIVDLPPLDYNVKVSVPGYNNISGNNSQLNLKDAFAVLTEVYDYVDSVEVKNEWIKTEYSDTVKYNQMQKFIARVKPMILVEQMQGTKALPYFGDEKTTSLGSDGLHEISLYDDENGYLLGAPLFTQANTYTLRASVFEEYAYYDESGNKVEDRVADRVPSQDATISFQSTMCSSNDTEVLEADSTGIVQWDLIVNKVDLTSATANINVSATVGSEDNATSFVWECPFEKAYTKGSVSQGNNFITAGPDKLLAVLRDPPGSNSYSYLEKGTTITETASFSGTLHHEKNTETEINVGTELITFTGVGVGTINSVVNSNDATVSANYSSEWNAAHTRTSTTTMTSVFSTSDVEDYVGAMADLFIGYSTNLSYGMASVITLVDENKYNANPDAYPVKYGQFGDYVLVQSKAMEAGTKFSTMFAYTQNHIEKYMLPEMIRLRNSFLRQESEMSPARFQAEANATKKAVYVSKLTPDDENYAKSNLDPVFEDHPLYYTKEGNSISDGPSYKIYYPSDMEVQGDTINYLNQSIDLWIARLADNEKAKVEAIDENDPIQNYSFQGGSTVEYSKGLSKVKNTSLDFTVALSAGAGTEIGFNILGSGCVMHINETYTLAQGTQVESGEENTSTVGFVLADNGNDYLSVDVYKEKENESHEHSTFIFRTRAGATSCPYEGEEVTKWYEPGKHVLSEATMQIEVPEIAVENAFIENVPSGESAYVTLYLRNNSAIQEDGWFNLIVDDKSNPNGAGLKMDGGAIGNGRTILVPAGETLVKTLEVTKGTEMNYDNLQLVLASQCQGDPTANFPAIADTVSFSVHFTPSCSDVSLAAPSKNWTYNTEMPTEIIKQDTVHYMNVQITDFNVNYDNFKSIRLMYKPSSASDENWITLMNYFADEKYYDEAVENGMNAEMIKAEDKGTIN